MKAQHWRPLIACVVVALTCLAFMVHAIRTDALTGLINPGPARILAAPLLVPKAPAAVREVPATPHETGPSTSGAEAATGSEPAPEPASGTASVPAKAPGRGAEHLPGKGARHPDAQPAVHVAGHAIGHAVHATQQVAHATQHAAWQTVDHAVDHAVDQAGGPRSGGIGGPPEHWERHLEKGLGVPTRHLVDRARDLLGHDDWHGHRYGSERGLRLGHDRYDRSDRPDAFTGLRGHGYGRGLGYGRGHGYGHGEDRDWSHGRSSQDGHHGWTHGRWGR
jgi:hypothetical protein